MEHNHHDGQPRQQRDAHRGAELLDIVTRDLRYVARGLRRTPGFAIAVVCTLALGIGANTAIFSVVDQVLFRPLPYPNGDRLLMAYESFQGEDRNVVSPANWLDWQRESRTIERMAAWRDRLATLTGAGEPAELNVQLVSSEFFPVLGVRPMLGRIVSEADDRPNAARVVVLSHRIWQQRFSSDPNIVGRVIQLNDQPVQVIGVMPAGFRFMDQQNDLWSAYQLDRNQRWRETSGRFHYVVARLRPGATIDAARAEMRAIAGRLAEQHVFNTRSSVVLVPLREELTGRVEKALLVLYVAVGVLLSIACFNVANLLLARAASRGREIAIRTSLGAGRMAIVRQLVIESVLLAIVGGALGIVLARWSLDALLAFAPADLLRVPDLAVDRRVLLYALGLSMATGVVVGLIPAMLVARRSILTWIRSSGSSVTPAPRVRQILVVTQVALTVVLLCGAGLLLRTMMALDRTSGGVATGNVLTMEVQLPGTRYDVERRRGFFREAVAALRALPGVGGAAASNSLAVIGELRGGSWFHRFGTPEVPVPERPFAAVRVVTPGYFRTLGIPVVRGREFSDGDDANPRGGFVVNEAFVKTYLEGVDPLAASLTVWMQQENPYLPIVGVVGDVSEGSVRDQAQPTVFYSHRQMPEARMTLFVRASQPTALANPAIAAIRRLDSNLAVSNVRTYEGAIAESLARERLSALVSGAFAVSGLLLASLGLYALLAYVVTERTKEIGIRIALGAQLGRVARSVVGGGLRLVAIGAAIGVAAALVLLRPVGTLLFGVTPHDAWTYIVVLTLFALVAMLASYVPARRASRVQPLIALRQE
jgi:putative ABC transport system permease protein